MNPEQKSCFDQRIADISEAQIKNLDKSKIDKIVEKVENLYSKLSK